MYTEITKCRVCGNSKLELLLDLGNQALTGIFPLPKEQVDVMPVQVVRCDGQFPDCCNLIQLKHTYDLSTMYGENYGYRSGLNQSMIDHLRSVVIEAFSITENNLKNGDLVIDIGSNDSTLLQFYNKINPNLKLDFIGIDPTGKKFKEFYPDYIKLIPDFFGSENTTKLLNGKKAKIITSIAMFYDLPDPVEFARQIVSCLDPKEGIWILEQAYTPLTIKTSDLSVFCQEHIEYYGLMQVKWVLEKVGMRLLNVSMNNSNGGSFRVVATTNTTTYKTNIRQLKQIEKILEKENRLFNDNNLFRNFRNSIDKEKDKLIKLLNDLKKSNKSVIGLGASTKFNVLLQYFGITTDLLPYVAEVNPYKFGRLTPGTNIPIISEQEASIINPDYYLVGPWHFKENILNRFKETNYQGKFIFPLPMLNII